MTVSTRTGWYFRMLKKSSAPLKGTLARIHTGEYQPSVREAFIAVYHPRLMSGVVEKVLAAPALLSAWREGLGRRLQFRK